MRISVRAYQEIQRAMFCMLSFPVPSHDGPTSCPVPRDEGALPTTNCPVCANFEFVLIGHAHRLTTARMLAAEEALLLICAQDGRTLAHYSRWRCRQAG